MRRALVIGGGIAGPIAAMALQRAGFEAGVYEAQGPDPAGGGAFINIAPNGLDALACIGLEECVRAVAFATPAMAFYTHTGRRITPDIPTGRLSARGTVIQTVRRAEIYRALRAEATRRGVPVEHGKRLVGVTSGPGERVRARFADGTSAEGDLLVGADGLRSRVRTAIDPQAPAPRDLGVLNAFGFVPRFTTGEEPGVIRMFFGRRSFFMYTEDPAGGLWWFANPPVPPGWSGDRTGLRPELLRVFGDDPMPAAEIIAATPELMPPFRNQDIPRLPVWHRDNMIVIGDAAHAVSPTVGAGASIAMEDAVQLAACLHHAPSVTAGFADYERRRRDRVERVVAQGKYNVDHNAAGPVGRVLRNVFIARAFRRPGVTASDPTWMHSHRIDWDVPAQVAS